MTSIPSKRRRAFDNTQRKYENTCGTHFIKELIARYRGGKRRKWTVFKENCDNADKDERCTRPQRVKLNRKVPNYA